MAVSGLLSAAVVGCSDDGPPEAGRPDATLSTAASSSSTSAVADPYAIPDDPADIDEAYVQRVIDALYEVDALAVRSFIDSGALDQHGVELLSTIYDAASLEDELEGWMNLLADPARLEAVRRSEGRVQTDVKRVRSRRADCIFVEAIRDYSLAVDPAPPPRQVFIGLTTREEPSTPSENPTPWILFQDGPQVDPNTPVEDPCAA